LQVLPYVIAHGAGALIAQPGKPLAAHTELRRPLDAQRDERMTGRPATAPARVASNRTDASSLAGH
jgi:hypothetical protein